MLPNMVRYKIVPHYVFGTIGKKCTFAKNYGKNETSSFLLITTPPPNLRNFSLRDHNLKLWLIIKDNHWTNFVINEGQ